MIATRAGLIEIRWHGRGGQGSVTSAELLAKAAIGEGNYAQGFPAFGPERRGAPVVAFNRINSMAPIRVRAEITEPDVVVVLDPTLIKVVNLTGGLREGGFLIINTNRTIDEIEAQYGKKWKLAVVNGTLIARETIGVPIVNTTMIGVLIRSTGIVSLESMHEPLKERFGRLAERNISAMKRAYDETDIKE